MLVSSPFLNNVYQSGQVVMWGYWMTFLILKNYVHDLSSIVLLRLEPYLQQMFDFCLKHSAIHIKNCSSVWHKSFSQMVKYTFFLTKVFIKVSKAPCWHLVIFAQRKSSVFWLTLASHLQNVYCLRHSEAKWYIRRPISKRAFPQSITVFLLPTNVLNLTWFFCTKAK